MRTCLQIRVAAPADVVFALARQVPRWSELLPHYRGVTVHRRSGDRIVAQMVAVRRFGPFPVPVTWRAEHWPDASDPGDLKLHFRHVRGVTRGMAVTWHIRPDGDAASRIRLVHDFRRRVPLLGADFLPFIVDRLFTQPIASRTLGTFKALAEGRAHDPEALESRMD